MSISARPMSLERGRTPKHGIASGSTHRQGDGLNGNSEQEQDDAKRYEYECRSHAVPLPVDRPS